MSIPNKTLLSVLAEARGIMLVFKNDQNVG